MPACDDDTEPYGASHGEKRELGKGMDVAGLVMVVCLPAGGQGQPRTQCCAREGFLILDWLRVSENDASEPKYKGTATRVSTKKEKAQDKYRGQHLDSAHCTATLLLFLAGSSYAGRRGVLDREPGCFHTMYNVRSTYGVYKWYYAGAAICMSIRERGEDGCHTFRDLVFCTADPE